MRVAMLIQRYHPFVGGAERQLGALAPRLQEKGVEVHILTRRYPGLAPLEYVDDVPVHRLPIPGPKASASLSYTLSALPILCRLQPHVIHAHELFSPATTAVLAKSLWGIPVVAKPCRGGMLGDVQRLRKKTLGIQRLRIFRQHVDRFAVISQEIDAELAKVGMPSHRRIFLPNGVDVERFTSLDEMERKRLRRALGLPDGPIGIFTGRLEPEKRVHHLVSIWPSVRECCQNALLLVLGSGGEDASLRDKAGAGVQFLGSVDDVAPYLQAADLFVLPSAAEGLSGSLLEAMAAALPVVATRVGGAPDVIDDGVNGVLVPPDQPDALREAIVALFRDSATRKSLGSAAQVRILERYTLAQVVGKLEALYEELVLACPSTRSGQPANASRGGGMHAR